MSELRTALEQNRDLLRELLKSADPRDAAGIARELRMTLRDLEELAGPPLRDSVESASSSVEAKLRLVQ